MTHPPFSPPRAALRWEAGARRGCAHRERPLPVFRLGGWPADWGGSAAPGGMMLRRGPWPWRARLLQTPGTQGRTHPQPPMPQVKAEPGGGRGGAGGRRLEKFAWGNFRGSESPAAGTFTAFCWLPGLARGRTPTGGRPGRGSGPRGPKSGSPPGAEGRKGQEGKDVRRRITSVKLGCGDHGAAARGAAQLPRQAVSPRLNYGLE